MSNRWHSGPRPSVKTSRRIAIWHNLPSGGGKRALHDQVRGLVERGHHVEIWCPESADADFLPLSGIAQEHRLPLPRPSRTEMDKRLRIPARVDGLLDAMEAHCRACAEAIMPGQFDILFAHSCTFFRSTPIARFLPLASALYQHEPYRWLYEAMPRLPWLAPEPSKLKHASLARLREWAQDQRTLHNARIQGREEHRNAAAFSRILVNSYFSRESVLRAYGLDAEVCYLGTDLSRFTDQGRAREPMVLGLGAFTREKNVRFAIEALANMPQPRPSLAWIGNVAEEGLIEEMTQLAEARQVAFTPHLCVPDATVMELLNRATALLYAPRLEPFGLAPIEAAACGLPVVGVAEGGVRETVVDGETGFLIPNDPLAAAEALGRIFADAGLARRMGQAARANAERKWSLEAGIDRIESALERVIARHTKAGQPA